MKMILSPCIYCGEQPKMFYLTPDDNRVKVGCYNTNCEHQPWVEKTFYYPDKPFSKEKAVDMWNDNMDFFMERATDELRKDFFNYGKI